MPGITTINAIADDVYSERLNIALDHWQCETMDVAFINSKGFGGNNATATILSPDITMAMMEKRHGSEAMASYQEKLSSVEEKQKVYQEKADHGQFELIYRFGVGVLGDDDIEINAETISMTGFTQKIALANENPFSDMT
jgi:acetoacetyl-[acyl-carrier protein] synthase